MSASPQATQSTKRPLEEASSPSRDDRPEAKRPALDKFVKEEESRVAETDNSSAAPATSADSDAADDTLKANGEKQNGKDAQGDTYVPDAPENKASVGAATGSSSHSHAPSSAATGDETAYLHVRALITSPEAATVIGKGGENVSKIRSMSGAKCTVSDYQKGAVERILTVIGVVDAVAKAFGLIIRTLNNEPLGEPSNTHSKSYPLRLLVPHVLIGSIIGKQGSRIKEIQEASGARLNASDACLALSSERALVVTGVADAVHIATYYVASTLLEQLNERFGGPSASAYATRSGGPSNAAGSMNIIPYVPQPGHGNYGSRENYNRGRPDQRSHHMPPNQAYAPQYGHPHAAQPNPAVPMQYGGHPVAAGGYGAGPHMPQQHAGPHTPQPHAGPHGQPVAGGAVPGQPLTQQIYIPNDMVGAIIGKGGQKINEIRQISGSVIKINEPQDNSNERLVTITGTEECNRMALYMLYSRLESEKHRI